MSLKRMLLLRTIAKTRIVNVAPVVVRAFNKDNSQDQENRWRWKKPFTSAVIFGSVLVGSALSDQLDVKHEADITTQDKNGKVSIEAGAKRAELPTYSAEEVSKHDSKSSFWVTYKHGVYDVTRFLPSHPGGEQILNAGGLSVEPFWNVYGMHKTDDILQLLESYRIGNLPDEDVVEQSDCELWAREPRRDPRLIVKTAKPFNAEIPPREQIAHFDTPNELFYVRQHMPVPELDAGSHKVRLLIKDGRPRTVEFSLDELRQFPQRTVRAALMCAGNRRSEMNEVAPVKGISWAGGAVSSAVWSGVYLRDVLLHCGVDLEDTHGKHVIFTGADVDATGVNFSTSIPLSLVAEPSSRILLATHMNGAPLPPDHGRPLRALVPGAPAVRSVKWLESITISEDESPSHWHQKDYRAFNPSASWATAEFARAPPVYSLPVTSAICSPAHGDTARVVNGCVEVKGYAYSGGGAKILRVDVSADRGRSWVEASALEADAAPHKQHYGWTLWRAAVPAPPHGQVELWVKATDSNFNTQPERFHDIWNIRGILSNAYHRIQVTLTS